MTIHLPPARPAMLGAYPPRVRVERAAGQEPRWAAESRCWRGPGWVSRSGSACVHVRRVQPLRQRWVDIFWRGDPDTVGEQGVEAACWLEAAGGGDAAKDQAHIKAAGGARLDHGELLCAPDAQVSLLWHGGHIRAKGIDHHHELVVERPKADLLPGVERVKPGVG